MIELCFFRLFFYIHVVVWLLVVVSSVVVVEIYIPSGLNGYIDTRLCHQSTGNFIHTFAIRSNSA